MPRSSLRRAVLAPLVWLAAHAYAATPMVSIENNSAVALRTDGTVYTWGNNFFGQLGDGTDSSRASPFRVTSLSNVRSVMYGGIENWAILDDGTVYTWKGPTPTKVASLTGVVAIAPGDGGSGGYRSAILKTDGSVCAGFSCTPVAGLPKIVAVSGTFGSHTLALAADGKVWAWGQNYSGQLGDGTTTNRTSPVQVTGLGSVAAISAGRELSLAVKRDGTVWVWGSNISGQLGTTSLQLASTPLQVPGLSSVVAIAAASGRALAVKSDGSVWEWGDAVFGGYRSPPRAVAGFTNAVAVWAATSFGDATFVLLADGRVVSYGKQNTDGQLGYGQYGGTTPALHEVLSINLLGGAAPNALPVAAFTMQVAPDASGFDVRCDASGSSDSDGRIASYDWRTSDGRSAIGPTPTFRFAPGASPTIDLTVGDDRQGSSSASAKVLPPRAAGRPRLSISNNSSFLGSQMHAVRSDGSMLGWGVGSSGELGIGSVFDRTVPARVALLNGVSAIAAGVKFSLALRDDGTVWSWGSNIAGELATGNTSGRALVPEKVAGLANVVAIAASTGAVAAKSDGTVWQWGHVPHASVATQPSQVHGLSSVIQVGAGATHNIALKSDGTVWAWGANHIGQLGLGHNNLVTTLVQVPITNVVAISSGPNHGLAIKADGTLWVWGNNLADALGLGTGLPQFASPLQVPGLADVAAAGAGYYFNVVAKRDGTVYTFGRYQSFGQVAGLADIVDVAGGSRSGGALRSDGAVFTWGYNDSGVLGDGTLVYHLDPVVVLNEDAGGSVDRDDWYLDLDASSSLPIASAQVPKVVAYASLTSSAAGSSLSATIKYKAAEFGSGVKNFVFGIVPASFLDTVKTAPGTPTAAQVRGKADPIHVQLTPQGWALVGGPLIAYSHATANAAGSAASILDRTPLPPGARFCIGYGASAEAMLGGATIRHVIGEGGGLSGGCVLSGVYLEGPPESRLGTTVTLNALVVALSPTGQVQFRDGTAPLGAAQSISVVSEAVSRGSLATASLAVGSHSIGADYSGNNPAMSAATPLQHRVVSAPPGSSIVTVTGPVESESGSEVAFVATVAGDNATGDIEFKDAGASLGSQPLVSGLATLRRAGLALGVHSITASYGGDSQNAAATSQAFAHTVFAPPGITLTAAPATLTAGGALTLTATVTARVPTGSIEVRDNDGRLIASKPLENGTASLSLSSLAPGTHYLSARYLDDAGVLRATSAAVAVNVQGDLGFTIAPAVLSFSPQNLHTTSAPRTVTITNTGFASISVSGIAATGAFAVAHDCATLAPASSCTASVTFTPRVEGAAAGTLTVTTTAGVQLAQLAGVCGASSFAITVTKAGTGSGTVASTPAGIDCGSTCSATFSTGSAITLTATPLSGSTFAGWSGASCTGTGACVLTVNAASAVTATFTRQPPGAVGLVLDPASLDFGGQSMGTTSPARIVTVTNWGPAGVGISGVTISNAEFSRIHDCATLAPGMSCMIQVRFTPAVSAGTLNSRVAVSGSLSIASDAAGSPHGATLAGTAEKSLVTHYYRAILGRAPDAGGQQYWEAEAQRLTALGANPNEVWFAMAGSFFNSAEYLALGRNATQYVRDLYTTFFNRAADDGGLAYWTGLLDAGMPRDVTLVSFMFSAEFTGFTRAIFGGTPVRAEIDAVLDFYRLLARLPDSSGYDYWVQRFRAAQCRGQAAVTSEAETISSLFLGSTEYAARNRANAQFVGDLYNAFLRRGGDLDGVRFWIAQLDAGLRQRDDVRRQFALSPEFSGRVNAIISQGCLP